jgi:hypothetical protein
VFAHHDRAAEAGAVLEADLERADVRNGPARAVGEQHFLVRQLFELELVAHVLRDAEVQRSGIGERIDLQLHRREARVAKQNPARHDAHPPMMT